MKKIALLLIAVAFSIATYAQANAGYLLSSPTHANLDTVTNTAAVTQVLAIPAYQDVVSIQVTITKISGTVAGSVVALGSLDGVTYDTITYATITNYPAYAPQNIASQATVFSIEPSKYAYYGIKYTGAGTMSASFKSYAIWRKH